MADTEPVRLVTQPVRILLLAGHPVVTAGLRAVLESHPGVRVVGQCVTVAEAVDSLAREPADVVLIDVDSEAVTLTAVGVLGETFGGRILVFTGVRDPKVRTRAIQLGACGVVSKDEPAELLVRAVLKVHAGELWLDRSNMALVLASAMRRDRDPERTKIESLTRREREIVELVGNGLKNGPISERLFISEATVRNHLTSILSKLGLTDRFELAVYAFRHGLLEHPPVPAARTNGGTAASAGAPSFDKRG